MPTVFYSWQSDLPNKTNRSFIEEILKSVVRELSKNTEFVNAERDESISLDKDTKDITGTPPITDTILDKISNCAVFVPDVSYVGETTDKKKIPNPNVLIEYGWALKSLGTSRIVTVMNTFYGNPENDPLPFDMRHLRRPITYCISGEESPEEKATEKDRLKGLLTKKLRDILVQEILPNSTHDFIPKESTYDPSCFLKIDEKLGSIGRWSDGPLYLPRNEHMYLRLFPVFSVEPFGSSKVVSDTIRSSGLRPPRLHSSGLNYGRNSHGAFVVNNNNDQALGLTQLMQTKELWGIEATLIDKEYILTHTEYTHGILHPSNIEPVFAECLENYLEFYKTQLSLEPPYKFEIGLTGVHGYRMAPPRGMVVDRGLSEFAGEIVTENIISKGEIHSFDKNASELLRPFFEYLWEEANLTRPDKEIL